MITERDIAEKFSVIWKQNFPMLTSNFIRVFNEAQIKRVNSHSIPMNSEVRYDLISEFSFNLAERAFLQETTIDEIVSNGNVVAEMIRLTARTIWKSGNYSELDLTIKNIETEEAKLISNNILEFISKTKLRDVTFKPILKGYGFVPDLIADISIDDTLFEVKTVNRNFRSSDLKQLFIYLALKQVSSEPNWVFGGLYNPRTGLYCKFNIQSLIYNLSGGKSPNEAFEGLLNSLTRDVEVDSKF